MDTQDRNVKARKLYAKLGYQEVDLISVSDGFNGLKSIKLVLLEKEFKSHLIYRIEYKKTPTTL